MYELLECLYFQLKESPKNGPKNWPKSKMSIELPPRSLESSSIIVAVAGVTVFTLVVWRTKRCTSTVLLMGH